MSSHYRIEVLIVCVLARKWCKFCVLSPVRFRGQFEEIGVAKVLFGIKSRRVVKFRGCRFSDVRESALRKKETVHKI